MTCSHSEFTEPHSQYVKREEKDICCGYDVVAHTTSTGRSWDARLCYVLCVGWYDNSSSSIHLVWEKWANEHDACK